MKLIIILSFISFGLTAQIDMDMFEKACFEDTIWIDINKCPYSVYGDAYFDMKRLQRKGYIKTCEITSDVLGYWITCKVVRNPKYSNYKHWLKHGELSTRIDKKGLIFVD